MSEAMECQQRMAVEKILEAAGRENLQTYNTLAEQLLERRSQCMRDLAHRGHGQRLAAVPVHETRELVAHASFEQRDDWTFGVGQGGAERHLARPLAQRACQAGRACVRSAAEHLAPSHGNASERKANAKLQRIRDRCSLETRTKV